MGDQCTREGPHGVRVQHGAQEDVATAGSQAPKGLQNCGSEGKLENLRAGRGGEPRGTAIAAVTA